MPDRSLNVGVGLEKAKRKDISAFVLETHVVFHNGEQVVLEKRRRLGR